jgi:hypothetical protein
VPLSGHFSPGPPAVPVGGKHTFAPDFLRDLVIAPPAPALRCETLISATPRTGAGMSLLDHLVGTGEQHRWHFEAERLSSLHIDEKLQSRRLFYG